MSKITITADSTPRFGMFISYEWSCADLIQWHKLNKSKYGKAIADQKIIDVYGGSGIDSRGNCVGMDMSSREYWQKEGLLDKISTGISGVISDITAFIVGGSSNLVRGADDVVESSTKGITNTFKTAKYLLPVLLIVVVGGFLYLKYQKLK